jgi:two-component system response regulator MprA
MTSRPHAARVLLIDDDPELSSILQIVLSSRAEITVALNWTDAKVRLQNQKFDLIILDLYLPDATLLEPIEHIHELDPDYPVVMISGNFDFNDNLIDRAMRLGINCFISKPFKLEELEAKLTEYLP